MSRLMGKCKKHWKAALVTLGVIIVLAFLTGKAGATNHRSYTVGSRVPSGLCENIRFKGTAQEISYDEYFRIEWINRHHNSEIIKRSVEKQKKYIARIQKGLCPISFPY